MQAPHHPSLFLCLDYVLAARKTTGPSAARPGIPEFKPDNTNTPYHPRDRLADRHHPFMPDRAAPKQSRTHSYTI
jgi:hypothetical protein